MPNKAADYYKSLLGKQAKGDKGGVNMGKPIKTFGSSGPSAEKDEDIALDMEGAVTWTMGLLPGTWKIAVLQVHSTQTTQRQKWLGVTEILTSLPLVTYIELNIVYNWNWNCNWN